VLTGDGRIGGGGGVGVVNLVKRDCWAQGGMDQVKVTDRENNVGMRHCSRRQVTSPVGQDFLACNRKFRMVDIANMRDTDHIFHADSYD